MTGRCALGEMKVQIAEALFNHEAWQHSGSVSINNRSSTLCWVADSSTSSEARVNIAKNDCSWNGSNEAGGGMGQSQSESQRRVQQIMHHSTHLNELYKLVQNVLF